MTNGVDKLNAMGKAEALSAMLTVCGSRKWAEVMAIGRPYGNARAVMDAAEKACDRLSKEDWLEAFSHHPRIGEGDLSQARFARTAEQSAREQSGMAGASEGVRRAFTDGNKEYEAKFGHVFLICATGKTGEEMLASLRARMGNDAEAEVRVAAQEQRAITRLRLERMLSA